MTSTSTIRRLARRRRPAAASCMGCVAASGGGGAGVRCWSLGCSAGEEAYSLALLWEQGVRRRLPDLGRVGFSRSRGP
jgi:hypothetical protein